MTEDIEFIKSEIKKINEKIKELRDEKKLEISPPCEEWLNGPGVGMNNYRANMLKAVLKSGIPLEIETKVIFNKQGYNFNDRYYDTKSKEGIITKQLDIHAWKIIEFSVGKTRLALNLHFIGDCIYSSICDYLIFNNEKKSKSSLIALNGKNIIRPSFFNLNFDLTSNKIVSLNYNQFTKKDDNFSNKTIFEKAEDVVHALNDFFNKFKESVRQEYKGLYNSSNFLNGFESELKSKGILNYQEKDINQRFAEYLYNNKDIGLDGIDSITLHTILPIIIINKERGLIAIDEINKSFVPLNRVLYLHGSSTSGSTKHKELNLEYERPIIIVNTTNLSKLINDAELEISKIFKNLLNSQDKSINSKIIEEIFAIIHHWDKINDPTSFYLT